MKVGSRVKVVDKMLQWTNYTSLFEKMGFKNPIQSRDLIDLKDWKEIKFVIFSKVDKEGIILYGIIDKKGNQFLVGEGGLEEIKKPKKVKEEESIEKPFPKLMKSTHSELIVYFENENDGQVVNNNKHWKNGKMLKGWAKESFQDIDAELIIKYNKK